MAKGTIWVATTLERASIRRSLRAKRPDLTHRSLRRRPSRRLCTMPPATVATCVASGRTRSSSWEATTTVAPACDGVFDQAIDNVATGLIKSSVRLIEQPQTRAANRHHCNGGTASLAGRQGHDLLV